jgi:hypothetical protein
MVGSGFRRVHAVAPEPLARTREQGTGEQGPREHSGSGRRGSFEGLDPFARLARSPCTNPRNIGRNMSNLETVQAICRAFGRESWVFRHVVDTHQHLTARRA